MNHGWQTRDDHESHGEVTEKSGKNWLGAPNQKKGATCNQRVWDFTAADGDITGLCWSQYAKNGISMGISILYHQLATIIIIWYYMMVSQ